MKDKTFNILLVVIALSGAISMVGLAIYGYNLWTNISIVEMISNWG